MTPRTAGLILAFVFGLLAGWLIADAQETGKVYRIGIITGGTASSSRLNIDPFLEGLRELGYVEGKNVVIQYRHADGNRDRLPDLAAELVAAKPDIILGTGTRPIVAASQATQTIPIVAGGAGDLVGRGLVFSLSRPGRNITGSTRIATEVSAKRIELLKQVVSPVSRIAVIWSTQQDRDELREMEKAVVQLGVEIQPVRLRDPDALDRAYETMVAERADALIIIHSGFALSHRTQLIELAVENRLPSMCETARWSKSGCLMSYGPDLSHLYRRAAFYVDKILHGANPADLPVERPTKFEFVINLKTANKLGITIPPIILYRAHELIR